MADLAPPTPPQPQPPQPNQAAPQANLGDLINIIAERAKPLTDLIKGIADQYEKRGERENRFQIHMAWIALCVVLSIVTVSGFLTYEGKIDGSTFTFLLGLIVGYVLTFVRDQITGPD